MQRFAHPDHKSAVFITIVAYALYVTLFAVLRDSVGFIIGALAVIPVMAASWYFGFKYGILVAVLCILNNFVQLLMRGTPANEALLMPGEMIGSLVLAFIALVVGNLKA